MYVQIYICLFLYINIKATNISVPNKTLKLFNIYLTEELMSTLKTKK
jgi:hypothetical protein